MIRLAVAERKGLTVEEEEERECLVDDEDVVVLPVVLLRGLEVDR